MSIRALTLASALTFATLLPAAAAGDTSYAVAHKTFVPNMITASYSNPLVATSPEDVRRQGGFRGPAAVRWVPVTRSNIGSATRFFIPAVVGAAFRDKSIATSPDEVRQQGGFTVPAAVRWKPSAPLTIVAKEAPIKVGAL